MTHRDDMTTQLTQEQIQQQNTALWNEVKNELEPTEGAVRDQDDEVKPATGAEAATTEEVVAAKPAAAHDDDDKVKLLDKISGMEQMLTRLTEHVRSTDGRLGGLNRDLQRLMSASKASGTDTPSAAEVSAASGSAEAMKELKENYPEFGEVLEKVVSATDKRQSELQAELQAIKASGTSGAITAEQVEERINDAVVEFAHPGWKQIVSKPEFAGWLERQQPEVRNLATSSNPRDAIRLLDLAAGKDAPATNDKTRRLAAAAQLPSGRSSPTPRPKPDSEKTAKELWDEIKREQGLT